MALSDNISTTQSTPILQEYEHSMTLDDVTIIDNESNTADEDPVASKIVGNFYPYVELNGYEFTYKDIISLELKDSVFLPFITLKIIDTDNLFQGKYFGLDGSVLNFYIRANNETLFKPIHINFDILSIYPSGVTRNGKNIFGIEAQMKVPNLYTEYCTPYIEMSAKDTLIEVSQFLNLGFASNETQTSDIMTWIHPYDPMIKFIQDVTNKTYKDENSFFVSYIDLYYNLTLVNVNTVFNNITIEQSEIYDTTATDILKKDFEFDRVPLLFTNHRSYVQKTKFIQNYKMLNNTGTVFLQNGYKRTLQFFDSISHTYNNTTTIQPQTGTDTSKMHLRGRMVDNNGTSIPEGYTDQYVKYKYMGKQNENVHDYFLYSDLQNHQNKEESNKMGMVIDLFAIDISIHRYMSIYILIYEYGMMRKEVLKSNDAEQHPELNDADGILNKFLSGFYVVTGIDFIFIAPGQMYQRLYLAKREFDAQT